MSNINPLDGWIPLETESGIFTLATPFDNSSVSITVPDGVEASFELVRTDQQRLVNLIWSGVQLDPDKLQTLEYKITQK